MYIAGFAFALSFIIFPVYAVETPVVTPTRALERRITIESSTSGKKIKTEDIQANVINKLKEKAIRELTRRLESLSKLIGKINGLRHLTVAQKGTMTGQIQTEINSLTALKTKITGDSDIATLRTDVQSIVSSYRIYALYIPKIAIIANADKILNLAQGDMAILTAKLSLRIDERSKNGVDITTISGYMLQRKGKLDDAILQANNAIAKILPLTPSGWPGNKTDLQSARDMLQKARLELNEAQKLANEVRVQLKESKPTGTLKPSPVPSL